MVFEELDRVVTARLVLCNEIFKLYSDDRIISVDGKNVYIITEEENTIRQANIKKIKELDVIIHSIIHG